MANSDTELAEPKSLIQEHPIGAFALFGALSTLLSLVIMTIAVSIDPEFRLSHGGGDTEVDVSRYFTSGAEHAWLAIGAAFGIVGIGLLAVAVIAKGIQLGRA